MDCLAVAKNQLSCPWVAPGDDNFKLLIYLLLLREVQIDFVERLYFQAWKLLLSEVHVGLGLSGNNILRTGVDVSCSHGFVGHRTPENAIDFKFPLVVLYYDVDYVKNPKGSNYWRNR